MADTARELFGSQTLPRLLALLIENPGRPMTAGELAQGLGGANRDSLYRALHRAEALGLVRRQHLGRTGGYEIASDSPIYPDLKGLLTKLLGLGPRLREALEGMKGIEQAFIYGSYASGRDSADSDVDLFVIGSLSGLELSVALRSAVADYRREINVTAYSREEVEARLAAQDPFIQDVWAKPKVMLIGDEAQLPQPAPGGQVGPAFAQEIAPRGMRFAMGYVLGVVSPDPVRELDEAHLNRLEEWAESVCPEAAPLTATPETGAWQTPNPGPGPMPWQVWIYPGPVLSVHQAIGPIDEAGEQLLSLAGLVKWWRGLNEELPQLLYGLGHRKARLGFSIEPYWTDRRLTGVDFTGLPEARGIGPHQVSPWQYIAPDFTLPTVPAAVLQDAVHRLLRHWSYRGVEATINALQSV